ncbi:unnamed protein product [Protopolystoma xenopodis]|uniref:Uncharacterized protein n=1 Tax=Protopolystoma xenopodis TaxID=117903 RepID=A0A448XL40_9PLAT|nr:unnamed protein product [Protopolystoma xenopodis]
MPLFSSNSNITSVLEMNNNFGTQRCNLVSFPESPEVWPEPSKFKPYYNVTQPCTFSCSPCLLSSAIPSLTQTGRTRRSNSLATSINNTNSCHARQHKMSSPGCSNFGSSEVGISGLAHTTDEKSLRIHVTSSSAYPPISLAALDQIAIPNSASLLPNSDSYPLINSGLLESAVSCRTPIFTCESLYPTSLATFNTCSSGSNSTTSISLAFPISSTLPGLWIPPTRVSALKSFLNQMIEGVSFSRSLFLPEYVSGALFYLECFTGLFIYMNCPLFRSEAI